MPILRAFLDVSSAAPLRTPVAKVLSRLLLTALITSCAGPGEGPEHSLQGTGPLGGFTAESSLLPFNNTGDLFVLEDECECILRITPEGSVTVYLTESEIETVTGLTDVDFDGNGIAFDEEGALYFSEGESESILKEKDGTIWTLASRSQLSAAQGFVAEIRVRPIAFGSDGLLYAIDDDNESVLQVFPNGAGVLELANRTDFENLLAPGETIDLDEGLAADNKGFLYVSSGGTPGILFKIALSNGQVTRLVSGGPLTSPDEFATRAPNGDLVIVDSEVNVLRITQDGSVAPFLLEPDIEAITGGLIELEGGLAFDSSGDLYLPEFASGDILRASQADCAAEKIEIWVTAEQILAATGEGMTELAGGIAFASRGVYPKSGSDDTNRNDIPDEGDEKVVVLQQGNEVSAFLSTRLDKRLDCILSNPHPLTGRYQTCYTETPLSDDLSGFFAGSNLDSWGFRFLLSSFCGARPLNNTITIDGYDPNLRPISARVESEMGGVTVETLAVFKDANSDGIADQLELNTILPLPFTTIDPTLVDTDSDGADDQVGIRYHEDFKLFFPLVDTNGDGIPDSPALDLDNDGVPDSDLPLFPFFAGPANPTTEQKLYFAQFGDGGDENAFLFSQIMLMNMDPDTPASVRVILRKDDGTPLSVELNGEVVNGEKELTIPAGGVVILKTDGVGDLTVGSATVVSDRAVAGVILFGGNVGVAGVGVSHPQKKGFIANIENNDSKQISTGLALMNLDDEVATYHLSLCDLNGLILSTAQLTLPARGHRSLFVFQLDWDPQIDLSDFKGLLKVTSNSPVAATALQTRPGEYATLPVAPNFGAASDGSSPARFGSTRSALQTTGSLHQKLYFPQFANGGLGGTSIFSQAILFNLTSQEAHTKLVLKKASGDPFTVTLNGETVAGEKELVIPAGGLAVLESDGQGELSEGSLTVHSDQALAGVVLFVGSAQAGTAGVGSSSLLLKGFWAPMENNSANSINTGLAVMNLEEETAELDLTLCDADGSQLATGELTIPALGQETFFPGEISWQPGQGVTLDFTDFIGLMKVSADGNTAAAVVQTRPGVFATLPVVPPLE